MKTNHYFDYCATTPIHPAVRDAMLPTLGSAYGNPSSMHLFGKEARSLVEVARGQVAEGLGASPKEIFFTSSATESNNLALFGLMNGLPPEKNHLITSSIEHHAILHTAEALAVRGFQVTYLPVDQNGMVSLADLESAIRPETGLISIMMVNNEVGSVQDIAGIGKIARKHGVFFHTDAVQAVNCFEIDVDHFQVAMLSLSAHKIYGPKGIGALYIRQGLGISPILFGGSQEQKIRPGTENVPGIVGLGTAMALRNDDYSLRYQDLKGLRQRLISDLYEVIPGVVFNGPQENAAPQVVSVSFPGVNGELLLFLLSQKGVAVSMGSACTADTIEPSHVLLAMGIPEDQLEGTLRISLGIPTTPKDISELVSILKTIVPQACN